MEHIYSLLFNNYSNNHYNNININNNHFKIDKYFIDINMNETKKIE
jgi:hypothetical protein